MDSQFERRDNFGGVIFIQMFNKVLHFGFQTNNKNGIC